MEMTRSRPNRKLLRRIKLWRYRWDTRYSGVGGENYKQLAEEIFEIDREIAKDHGFKASKKLTIKKLNREFSRAYYYFMEEIDKELKAKVRTHNYYIKGKTATFNFEVTDVLAVYENDDDVTRWLTTEEGPEVMALLRSVARNPDFGR